MTSLSDAISGPKILALGKPKTGKTGALAALPPIGYRLRILDFDDNLRPLATYLDKKYHDMIDVLSLEDRLRGTARGVSVAGVPEAFSEAIAALDEGWTTTDGKKIPPVVEWGLKDILVIDSLTAMGRAAMRLQLAVNNRSDRAPRKQDWGEAQGRQEGMVEIATSSFLKCPVYFTAHTKMIGPKEVEPGDDDTTKKVRAAIVEVVATKLYPSALGRALPQDIAQHFDVALEFAVEGRPARRVIRTTPSPELEIIGVPVTGLPSEVKLEDGLARIFKALA